MKKTRMLDITVIILLILLSGCQKVAPTVQLAPDPQPTPQVNPTPADGVFVDLTAPVMDLGVGESLIISVEIHRVENLMGAQVHLQFDPKLLHVEDAEPGTEGVAVSHGEFLEPDFIAINASDNLSGSVDYAVAQMQPHPAVDGSGTLCRITVKAAAAGSTSFTLTSVVLADANGQQIPAIIVNDTLDIEIK
jgi:hypothetical protein